MDNDTVNTEHGKEGASSGADDQAKAQYLQALGEDISEEAANRLWEEKQSSTKAQKELEEKVAKVEQFARNQQAEKDRYFATLQKHNLTPDGRPVTPPVQDSPVYKQVHSTFLQRGFTPEQANQAAELQVAMLEPLRNEILQSVGQYVQPLVGSVGSMEADRQMQQVISQDKTGYYQDPSIQQVVRQNIQAIVDTGGEFNPQSIDWMFKSEVGNLAMQGKLPQRPNQQQAPMYPQTPNFSTRPAFPMQGGGAGVMQYNQQAPQPSDANNAQAIAHILPHLFKNTSKDPQMKGKR